MFVRMLIFVSLCHKLLSGFENMCEREDWKKLEILLQIMDIRSTCVEMISMKI